MRTGATWCKWHDPEPDARQRHREESARGGKAKAYGALAVVAPLADMLDLDTLDLTTPSGVMALLAAALGGLARLPFDVRTANAIGQVATATRHAIEATDLAQRIEALEAMSRSSDSLCVR